MIAEKPVRQPMPFQLSLGLRATADQQVARFHRESDRRRLRAMAASVVGAGLLVVLVLSVVGLKVQQVRLSYRLDTLRTTRTELEEANRRLSVERASLSSLGRIEGERRVRRAPRRADGAGGPGHGRPGTGSLIHARRSQPSPMTEFRSTALRSRTLIFAAFVACAFLGILVRIGYLQVFKHEEYSRLAEAQRAKTVPLRPKRGPIFDRAGLVLAESAVAESLFGLPTRMSDSARVASELASILGEPAPDIARRLDPDKRFVWVKRKLPPRVAQAVQDLHEPTLGFIQESLRLYPNRELAAHVVGFEGLDGKGLSGIEQAWDVHLAGAEGKALVERDALGRDVTGAPKVLKPSVPGQGVALTIDATLQYIAEKEVDAAWRRTRAKGAMAVMMDPRSGEILALAIRPTFNPNAFGAATDDQRRNRALTDPFEPGSTFKVIMAAAALEEGVVRPTDRFYGENGKIKATSAVISVWKPFGWLTFSEVLQNSSNVGSIKAGMQLGKERYYRYINGFGFGQAGGLR